MWPSSCHWTFSLVNRCYHCVTCRINPQWCHQHSENNILVGIPKNQVWTCPAAFRWGSMSTCNTTCSWVVNNGSPRILSLQWSDTLIPQRMCFAVMCWTISSRSHDITCTTPTRRDSGTLTLMKCQTHSKVRALWQTLTRPTTSLWAVGWRPGGCVTSVLIHGKSANIFLLGLNI